MSLTCNLCHIRTENTQLLFENSRKYHLLIYKNEFEFIKNHNAETTSGLGLLDVTITTIIKSTTELIATVLRNIAILSPIIKQRSALTAEFKLPFENQSS
ncbi:hypothetical protein PV328_001070 [Microctonus aethiopoides]|uniref:Uncharacterized protein n=1 Tax=Microctonus aethiopoides TaxID=144406 RepID=A0AA39FW56_9HYME|nr:hypothetical protein PV328_001070 [Microctonus aethiopoides]